MGDLNFYKHHIGDYLKKTAHLSIAEHGAYLLMLQTYYATETPLPRGEALYRVLRATTKHERAAVDAVLRQFWRETDEGYTNGRADEEIATARRQREVNRETGKRGGRPPKTNRTETESVSESVSEPEPKCNPIQTPDSRLQSSSLDNPLLKPSVISSLGAPNARSAKSAKPPIQVDDLVAPEVSREAIAEWREHREAIGKPLRPHELIAFGKTLRAAGPPAAQLATVRNCIANGWANLRHADAQAGNGATPPVVQTWTPPDDEPPEERARA